MSNLTMLEKLEIPGHSPSNPGTNSDHPMRVMTRRAAGLQGPPWGPDAVDEVAGLFNTLAPEWHTRESDDRSQIVVDALQRGLDPLRERSGSAPGWDDIPDAAVELGSGLGTYSALLADRFAVAMAAEISEEMHRRAHSSGAIRILADGSSLPLSSSSLGAVVLVNCFLFPTEITRVLAPGGIVLWVNSSGESTPIHLSTTEVVGALPFEVVGVEARAGIGTWCALRRTP